MSQKKILLKERVLTCGQGNRRAVLDYDSNLAYQYDDPSNVLAVFEPSRGWITVKKPRYYRSGWGNESSGNADGHFLIANLEAMFSAIGARVLTIDSERFLSQDEIKKQVREVMAQNKIIERRNKLSKKLHDLRGDAGCHEFEDLKPLPGPEDLTCSLSGRGGIKKGTDPIKMAQAYTNAVQVFIKGKGKPVKLDAYTIEPDQVIQGNTVVAFRDDFGNVFMNSQVLQVSNFEKEFLGNQSLIQSEIRKVSKYNIPFNVLQSANLLIGETRVIEQGPESTHRIKKNPNSAYDEGSIDRHFTGAVLLENAGRKFLMDIDRREIQHGIFNAFFVEVSPLVSTIADAYDSMKPAEVKRAELNGLEVLRQGEWFFIPTDKTVTVETGNIQRWLPVGGLDALQGQGIYKANISHGKGRPNSLYKPYGFVDVGSDLVCGTVEHSGREHAALDLGMTENKDKDGNVTTKTFKLWKVVGNTTVSNFTIKGDVD